MRVERVQGVRCRRGWCCALLLAAAVLGSAGSTATRAPPLCPPALPCRCVADENYGFNQFKFKVDKKELHLNFLESSCFSLYANVAIVTLDEQALPCFETMQYIECVEIEFHEPSDEPSDYPWDTHVCDATPEPAVAANETTYAAILRALNVSGIKNLSLTSGTLRSEYLADLIELRTLELQYVDLVSTARDLRHLTGLRHLSLEGTNFTATDLELLPVGLEKLHLVRTRIGRVPAAALEHLSHLTGLIVTEDEFVYVEAAGGLQSLTMKSDEGADAGLALPSELENLTITGWAPRRQGPRPWETCARLRNLELLDVTAEVLPARWVANCKLLDRLILTCAKPLVTLNSSALLGASLLKHLSLQYCNLETLPADLLKDLINLTTLDLANNHLRTLPSSLFADSVGLRRLVLSENSLSGSVLDALQVAALRSLNELHLNNNKALNTCPTELLMNRFTWQEQTFKFVNLKNLNKLDLSHTNTTQFCAEWRQQLPALQELVLRNTTITRLKRADLRFNTAGNVTVDLTDANVTGLDFTREDAGAASAEGAVHVHVMLSEPLLCDCRLYWARTRLLVDDGGKSKGGPGEQQPKSLRCTDGRELRNVPPAELVCATRVPCPANCTCGERDDEAVPAPGRVLRVACERAGLRRVPALPAAAAGFMVDLQLAHNNIDSLDREDLPANLTTLDLRNNSLTLIDAATVTALVSSKNRRVLLAGNPLNCSCRAAAAAALAAAVRERSAVFADRTTATCVGGMTLSEVAPALQGCGAHLNVTGVLGDAHPKVTGEASDSYLIVVVVASVVVVVMLAVALVVAVLRPELRLRVKAALRARGLLPRAREFDDGRVYDAFVSFAHADEAVVRELVERLESGAAPLRLCVHYRDWAPGGWIPTQIAASVRVSRRTVAVVSAAFLRSRWARAEFREAYAAALRDAEPRLVVVLLDDPARLPLDAELRAYLAANTYVRWGDPWFWPKLRRALPAPRRPARRPPLPKAELYSGTMTSNDVSIPSAATASTDASVLSVATVSTDLSVRSSATVSTDDGSTRSAATVSTDVSVRPVATMSVQ